MTDLRTIYYSMHSLILDYFFSPMASVLNLILHVYSSVLPIRIKREGGKKSKTVLFTCQKNVQFPFELTKEMSK